MVARHEPRPTAKAGQVPGAVGRTGGNQPGHGRHWPTSGAKRYQPAQHRPMGQSIGRRRVPKSAGRAFGLPLHEHTGRPGAGVEMRKESGLYGNRALYRHTAGQHGAPGRPPDRSRGLVVTH